MNVHQLRVCARAHTCNQDRLHKLTNLNSQKTSAVNLFITVENRYGLQLFNQHECIQ